MFSLETTGNFSILCFLSICSASLSEVPSFTVIKFVLVITSLTGLLLFFSKRKSRFVTIPINSLLELTIGIPPILYFSILVLASETNAVTGRVTGSKIIPDSERFTDLTFSACSSIVMFLCNTPIPPSRANAIAISLSVTVSIAADTIGIFKGMFLLNLDDMETSLGNFVE